MNCKTVMVNLAIGGSNKPRLAVAKQLAERLEARLIGVTASEITPPLYFADGDAGQRMIEASMTAIEVAFSTLEAEFYAEVDGCRSEWRCSRQMPTQYVAQEARAADVIVTGQSQNIMMSSAFASADASDLIMDAGRPLLIVPNSVRWIDFRHCVVAWKEAAESRRAIADALPLLRLAKALWKLWREMCRHEPLNGTSTMSSRGWSVMVCRRRRSWSKRKGTSAINWNASQRTRVPG